jgi:hypothetical protein
MDATTVDIYDPARCTASDGASQCLSLRLPGHTTCSAHNKGAEKRMYRLSRAEDRKSLSYLCDHSDVHSLREEIALLRMLLVERLNDAQSIPERTAAFGAVQAGILAIEKLVKSAHQMEKSLGSLMSKGSILEIAGLISAAIAEELQDVDGYEEIVDRLDTRIIDIVQASRE